jgi:hypothetical protein
MDLKISSYDAERAEEWSCTIGTFLTLLDEEEGALRDRETMEG